MTTIAINRQRMDFGKFIAAVIVAFLFVGLLTFSATRTMQVNLGQTTLNPCKTCTKCACPRLQGSISCGCPR